MFSVRCKPGFSTKPVFMVGTPTVGHSDEELTAAAAEITWFHTMDLRPGLRTSGIYDPSRTLPRLHLPDRLAGQTVLDVGAWDGYYSFEMERRGADVLATDDYSWGGGGWGTKAGFDLAHAAFGSRVRSLQIDPLELSPDALGGRFDIVLMLGVLYHLRDPLRVLERVAAVTAGLLVLETEVGMLLTRRPAAEFFPGTELNDDPTNWWAPNVAAMTGMLRAVGFRTVEVAWRRPLPLRVAKWAKHLRTPPRQPLMRALTTDRFVFHARAELPAAGGPLGPGGSGVLLRWRWRKSTTASVNASLRSPATMCPAPDTSTNSALGTSDRNDSTPSTVTTSLMRPRTSITGTRNSRQAMRMRSSSVISLGPLPPGLSARTGDPSASASARPRRGASSSSGLRDRRAADETSCTPRSRRALLRAWRTPRARDRA